MTGAEFSGVDIDLLADYIGGALEGTPEQSAVASRIAADPEWQVAYETLGDDMAFVAGELGRLGEDPMPADVVARLDAALQNGAISSRGPDDAQVTGTPAPQLTLVHGDLAVGDGENSVPAKAPSQGRRLGWAAPIAVAAGLVAFVGFGADYLHGRSQGAKDSTSSAGSAAQAPTVRPLASGQLLTSGMNYSHATLGAEPVREFTAPAPFSSNLGGATRAKAAEPALSRLSESSALADCLNLIAQENGAAGFAVESVDFARFAGVPAVIVRFSASNGRWAWASGADCGTAASGAATLDKVPVG